VLDLALAHFRESRRSRPPATGHCRSLRQLDCAVVYRRFDVNVYRKSANEVTTMRYIAEFRGESRFRADYHQQYLAKNPDGYCGIGGCGVPFKLAASRA
jgi:hypothetical protein